MWAISHQSPFLVGFFHFLITFSQLNHKIRLFHVSPVPSARTVCRGHEDVRARARGKSGARRRAIGSTPNICGLVVIRLLLYYSMKYWIITIILGYITILMLGYITILMLGYIIILMDLSYYLLIMMEYWISNGYIGLLVITQY